MLYRALLVSSLAAVLGSGNALASYPERPIKLIIPFSAGGGSDTTARLIVPYLQKNLPGAKFAVINKPGAGGSIAYTQLASAPADGYTIGMVNFPDVITGPITSKVKYASSDFEYLGAINREPTTISVLKSSAHKNLKSLLAAAKAKPGSISIAVPSLRNVHSVGLTLLSAETGIKFAKIPFKGGGPARNALLGGHVDAAALSMGAAAKKASKLNILMQMSRQRAATGQDVPTIAEAIGITTENYVTRTLAVKKGTPAEVVSKLRAAFKKALSDPALIAAAAKRRVAINYLDGVELASQSKNLKNRLVKLWQTNPWMQKK